MLWRLLRRQVRPYRLLFVVVAMFQVISSLATLYLPTVNAAIIDDGVGFDTFEHPLGGDEMGGYGLLSMAERAEIVGGRLNIRSRPGTGTTVTATIPVP